MTARLTLTNVGSPEASRFTSSRSSSRSCTCAAHRSVIAPIFSRVAGICSLKTVKMPMLAADGHFWDPVLKIFDFSLLFEETIFQLIPSCFAILVSLIFITHHQHEPVYVRSSPLLWTKVVSCSTNAICAASNHHFPIPGGVKHPRWVPG